MHPYALAAFHSTSSCRSFASIFSTCGVESPARQQLKNQGSDLWSKFTPTSHTGDPAQGRGQEPRLGNTPANWKCPTDAALPHLPGNTHEMALSLLPQMQHSAKLSCNLPLGLRGTRTWLHEYLSLPSLKGVFGGTFSLLSCWKALEGSKRLMPWIVHSCCWRFLLVCFSLASNARSFETSWK